MTGGEALNKFKDRIIYQEFPFQFRKIKKIMDFVVIEKDHKSQIDGGPIATRADRKIIAKWGEHFKKKKIPFIIVEYETAIRLWKEDLSVEKIND